MKISMNWPLSNNCNITNLFVLYRACCAFLCNCEYLKNELTIFVDLQRNCSSRLDRLNNPWGLFITLLFLANDKGLNKESWSLVHQSLVDKGPPVFYIKRDEGLYKRTNITIILKYRFLLYWVCCLKVLHFINSVSYRVSDFHFCKSKSSYLKDQCHIWRNSVGEFEQISKPDFIVN